MGTKNQEICYVYFLRKSLGSILSTATYEHEEMRLKMKRKAIPGVFRSSGYLFFRGIIFTFTDKGRVTDKALNWGSLS